MDFLHEWTGSSTAVVVLVPWAVLLGMLTYYFFFKRVRKMDRQPLAPMVTFFSALTDGASAGFDQQLLRMFHPALLKEGQVERGVVRAMVRCLCAQFGPVVDIPRDTVVMRRDGLQVNCAALVNFTRCRGVKCQLSWVDRIGSVVPRAPGPRLPAVIDGVRLVPLHSFHVTRFHVEPKRRDEAYNVLEYLDLEDFEPFAERFVERLFLRPPRAAVEMMVPPLRDRHAGEEALLKLQDSVAAAVAACGGLRDKDVDAVLVEKKMCWSEGTGEEGEGKVLNGVEMTFQVAGNTRDARVIVGFTLVSLSCRVTRYEVVLCPDQRLNLVVDKETQEATAV